MFFGIKNGLPAILTTIVKLPILSWVQNNLEKSSHNSEPSYQSGCNIIWTNHEMEMAPVHVLPPSGRSGRELP